MVGAKSSEGNRRATQITIPVSAMIRQAVYASALGAVVPSCASGMRRARNAIAADGDGERITVDESLPFSRVGADH